MHSETCAVVFSHDGYIKRFQGSKEFEDLGVFIDVRSRLDPSSRAASFFRGCAVRTTPKRVSASAWFAPGRYQHDAKILEQSWTMPSYNAVLTLLWVDDDIEDEDDLW